VARHRLQARSDAKDDGDHRAPACSLREDAGFQEHDRCANMTE
jgi:hypothetical protein